MSNDLRHLRRDGFRRQDRAIKPLPTHQRRPPPRPLLRQDDARVVTPSLAQLDPALPATIATRSPLARSWRSFEQALDDRIRDAVSPPEKMTQP
jgi:hypothetical protein